LSDPKSLQKERISIFQDVQDSRIPRRVPVNTRFSIGYVAQFGGLDMAEAQWNPQLVEEAADKLCRTIYSDSCPYDGSIRYPSYYRSLESQSFVMSSSGFIQHPEVVGMFPEDYDYLIEKPLDCLIERILPRQYKALDSSNPVKMAFRLAISLLGYENDFKETGNIISKLTEKYGYGPGVPPTANGFTEAPFDFIADQLRGFKEISLDIRRRPEKLAEACEALYPILFKKGLPVNPSPYSTVFLPLHMPTYMREKDFARLWWPSFKRMVDEYASLGIHCRLYCEDDWTRYLDYLYELPTNTVLMFEYGDAKLIKENLGKKHIITGLYPVTMLKSSTKEQCLQKAQEMLDILAPGGKFIFALDKPPLSVSDINMDNYCAVTEFVRDYGVYANAGENAGLEFKKEDYAVAPAASRKLESKYLDAWADSPELAKLQVFEDKLFQYLIFLLL
jgi:hypothetical protein